VNATRVLWKTQTKPKKVGAPFRSARAWSQCRRTKYENQVEMNALRKKANAVRASHPDRIPPWFPALPITAWRRNDRFSSTALQRVPHLPKRVAHSSFCHHEFATPAVASGPSCSEEQGGGGGRNARATSRACARFLECPPAIHPRESPAAAGSAAIIRQAQELSRFAEPTVSQIVRSRNTKEFRRCAEPVEDETSLWKIEENQE
jgi:hypothetical protein